MENEQLWKEMLGTLKDISTYLEKQDDIEKQIVQERASVDKRPKAGETQDPIEGGPAGVGHPAEGIAKQLIPTPTSGTSEGKKSDTPKPDGATMLKAGRADDDDEEEESEESEESETSDDGEELKSLLKDIREALAFKSDVVKSEIKKALPAAVESAVSKHLDKTLRKMGFTPTHADVTRIGLDTTSEVKKSEDERVEGDIKKSEDKGENDLLTAIEKLSKNASWQQLGQMREKQGLFRIF